jgi:uncharacterized protein DUF4145
MTFDILAGFPYEVHYNWQNWYEAFALCRHCHRGTIFILSEKSDADYKYVHKVGLLGIEGAAANRYLGVEGYISLKDKAATPPPEHLPKEIEAAFKEAATCLAVGCFNAAGTMFRLCVDLATRSMLPAEDTPGLDALVRRILARRLSWLFANGRLPEGLKELSSCIRDDGNDGAHAGTLTRAEAEDLLDFTTALLTRLYTEPERLRLAEERRVQRRAKTT